MFNRLRDISQIRYIVKRFILNAVQDDFVNAKSLKCCFKPESSSESDNCWHRFVWIRIRITVSMKLHPGADTQIIEL